MKCFTDHQQGIAGFAAGLGLSLALAHFWIPPWCKHEKTGDKQALPERVGYRTVYKNDLPNPNHSYKLIYFNVKGFAEPSRFIFALAGAAYDDFRYPIEFRKGTKPDFPEFDKDTAAGKFNHTLMQIPVLEVDGKLSFGQSKAIERYLARQFGFWGQDEAEGAQVDAICEHIREVQDAYRKVRLPPSGEVKDSAPLTEFLNKELPNWLKAIEDSLVGVTGYSVGPQNTHADILIYHLFVDLLPKEATGALRNRPKLSAIYDRLASNPRLQEWLRKRPDTVV